MWESFTTAAPSAVGSLRRTRRQGMQCGMLQRLIATSSASYIDIAAWRCSRTATALMLFVALLDWSGWHHDDGRDSVIAIGHQPVDAANVHDTLASVGTASNELWDNAQNASRRIYDALQNLHSTPKR